VRQWNELLLRHVSKTANDTGYYLEEQGQPDEAWEAYQAARRIEPNNLSALLNLITLAAARQRPEEAALRGELQRLTERSRERFNLWALAYHYGYVRRAEAFAGRGMAWAMSGKPNLAVAEIQRAMGLGLRGEKIQLALADAYLQQDKVTEGEAELRRVLADNPKQPEAISALLQLALRRRDFDAARAWLARYREAGGDAQEASFREAIIELQIGNRETARDLLDRLLRRRADYAEALTLRLLLAHEDQDAARFDALAEPLLKKSAALSSAVQRTLARLFLFRREPARARELLNLALRRQPADLQALDLMLRLCILEAKRDEAEDVVQRILTIAPRHAFANMALGSIQLSREMYELAEASYRASLQTERDPLTLNELAYTLHLRGKNEEALPLIREALEKNDRNGAAWDTLGAILLRLNRLEEAEPALQKALALLPEAPDIIFHMALLYEARGLRRESRDLAEKLMERPNTLRPAAFDELRALLARLRGDAPPRP